MRYFARFLVLLAAVPAYSESAASAALPTGWLDVADCSAISGWAWNAAQPSAGLEIDLYDGTVQGSPFATIQARNYRLDLQQAGIGDGVHGFLLSTPASLKDGRPHAIVAAVAGTDAQLQIGLNTLSCPAEAIGYHYYVAEQLNAPSPGSWAA